MTATRRWNHAAVDVAAVPPGGLSVRLSAGAGDRRSIAGRLGLPAVETCTASFALLPQPGRGILVEGRLSARLIRLCVVTGDPMEETVDQPFACLVVAKEPAPEEDGGADEPDYEVAPDGRVDLAELAVQFLSVSMEAYPRGPDADEALAAIREDGLSPAGGPETPFAGLGERMGMPEAGASGSARDRENGDNGRS